MPREKQLIESKELIKNGLLRLLKQKELSSINMTDIAKEADVVRMTLYRHFKSKEEIILHIIEQRMDCTIEKLMECNNITLYDIYLFRFRFLKESPFTKSLYDNNQFEKLFSLIRKRTLKKMSLELLKNYDPFVIEFIGGGVDAITLKWISEGMKYSPEEMAHKTDEIVTSLLLKSKELIK